MPQTRQLAAIMFTDIVGYTALMGEGEQKAFQILQKNRELQKPIIEKYNGRWIKELGDGVMASFITVSDAVHAAKQIQEQCLKSGEFSLRIGIHVGEIVFEGEDVFGDAVNIAARIQAIASVGGIFVSEAVHYAVANKPEIKSSFVKTEILKNVKEPANIYEIIVEQLKPPTTSRNPINKKITTVVKKKITVPVAAWIIGALVLLIAVAVFLNKEKISANSGVQTLAVLPFINESGNADGEYLSDGMTETLTSNLSQLPKIKVKARTSVFRYKGKALVLDEKLSEAHNSLAYVLLYYDWDFAAAEEEFKRAIELNPRYAVAHQWYANLLTAMGRWNEQFNNSNEHKN
jgi:class 3 adenylate cyclase